MTKVLLMVLISGASQLALADRLDNSIAQDEPCALQGERAYVQNGEDHEVFVCDNGKWEFLFTSVPQAQD